MNDLYLSTVELTNFRSFGTVPPIELHPGPGALLLVGPNGLGKSSWFEAIEVALTGSVRRWDHTLRHMPERARTRLNQASWSVELGFLDQEGATHAVRRSGPAAGGGTPIDDVLTLLAPHAQDWSLSASNFTAFLHMTHILPQSARLRFLAEVNRQARWDDWLSHVCGFERVARAQVNVGATTKKRLTAEIARRATLRTEAQQRVDKWRSDRRALEDMERSRAATGEVWSPRRVREELTALQSGETLAAPAGEATDDALVLLETLSRARVKRAAAIAQIEDWLEVFRGLRSLLGDLAAAATQRAELEADLQVRVAEEVSARTAVETAGQAVGEAQLQQVEATNAGRMASEVAAAIQARLAAADRLAEATGGRDRASETLRAARERMLPLEERRQEEAARVTSRREWDAAGSAIARRIEELAEATRRLTRASALYAEIGAAQARDGELADRIEARQPQLVGLRGVEQETQRLLRAAEDRVEAQRRRNTAIMQAIAALAAHVHEADRVCPLCTHDWEQPGLLFDRARRELEDVDPLLVEAEAEVVRLREVLAGLGAQSSEMSALNEADKGERGAIETAQKRRRDEMQDLRDHPLLVDGALADLAPRLAVVDADLATDREVWSVAPASLLPGATVLQAGLDELTSAIEEAEGEVRRCETVVADADRAVASATTTADTAVAILQALSPSNAGDERALVVALNDQARATAAAAPATDRLRLANEGHRAAVAGYEHAQERRRAVAAEIAKIDLGIGSIRARWSSAGLEGEPASEPLEAAITDAEGRVGRERADDALLARATEALTRWRDDVDLSRLRRQLATEAGGPTAEDWDAYDKRLVDEHVQRDAAVKRAELARRSVAALSTSLDDIVKEFRPRLADSLAGPLKALLPVMIQDERFHGVRLRVEGTGKKSTVAATLPEHGEVEADHLLSEGQMSGVSLAVMLATASAFRWSRWPGLLLDDPTQHNDLVHAANLIEVLRTMILAHGFQIVVSTHDRDLADFFQRKLRHAGIPGRTCAFRDPDPKQGVIPSVTAW